MQSNLGHTSSFFSSLATPSLEMTTQRFVARVCHIMWYLPHDFNCKDVKKGGEGIYCYSKPYLCPVHNNLVDAK